MTHCQEISRRISFGPLGKDPFLKCYNGDGKELWRYNHIGPLASVSAPMIDAQGRVIACDARNIIMFDENGKVLWKLKHASGVPISPVYAENGLIIIVTTNGWIQTVDPLQGEVVGEFQLTGTLNGKEGVWATRNTPAVSGTRLYTITEFFPSDFSLDETSTGRLFAVDLKTPEEGGNMFEIAWSLDFGARSGGSPTIGTCYCGDCDFITYVVRSDFLAGRVDCSYYMMSLCIGFGGMVHCSCPGLLGICLYASSLALA
jgi:outer membrane protein assembly factor BamB